MEAEERHKYASEILNQQINKLKEQYGSLERQKEEEVANLKDTIEVRLQIILYISWYRINMVFSWWNKRIEWRGKEKQKNRRK